MKQTVRRDALAGITEYYTDETAARTKEQEDADAFDRAYYESLNEEWAEERRTMLSGSDPETGLRYSSAVFASIIYNSELTQDELYDAENVLLGMLGDESIDAMIADEMIYGH